MEQDYADIKIQRLDTILKNSFTNVRRDMNDLKEFQSQNDKNLLKLKEKIDLLSEKNKFIPKESFDAVIDQVGEVNSKLGTLTKKVDDYEVVKKEFSTIQKDNLENSKKLERMNDKMAKLIVALEHMLDNSQVTFTVEHAKNLRAEMIERIKKVSLRVDDLGLVEKRVKDIEKKIITQQYLDRQVGEITDMITSLREAVERIKDSKVSKSNHEAFIKETDNRLKNIQKEKEILEKDIVKRIRNLDNESVKKKKYGKDIQVLQKRTSKLASKKVAQKSDKKQHTNVAFILANFFIVVAFIALAGSIVTYFMRQYQFVYPLLIGSIVVFVVGIILRLAGVFRE